MYNFDEVINRKGTDSIKHDAYKLFGHKEDELSMWVADMDFRAPKEVGEALKKLAEFNIYGYSEPMDNTYFEAVASWMKKRHNLTVEREWLVKSPGIVYAISIAIRALTKPSDNVAIMEPVYYPFRSMIEKNGRKVVTSDLININGHFEIDFEDFENKIRDNDVKLLIFCSPHNPVSRVWTTDELKRVGNICKKYGVYLVSDEIHADFTHGNNVHTMMPLVDESFFDFTILCTAPSKTFNLAGLQVSNIFIKNKEIRDKFKYQIDINGTDEMNIFGLAACKAAYNYGETWLDELLEYLQGNIDFVDSFLKMNSKKIKLVKPEGTYLLWLDMRELLISDEELNRRVTEVAKLWLDGGSMFGKAGEGYQRVNIACPRSVLEEAMKRLIKIEAM